jgi:hypothetical protein
VLSAISATRGWFRPITRREKNIIDMTMSIGLRRNRRISRSMMARVLCMALTA